MKKRILVLLSALALMVVMLATSVTPAFARNIYACTNPNDPSERPIFARSKFEREFLEGQGYVCTKLKLKKIRPES
jgi:hypothetical protein